MRLIISIFFILIIATALPAQEIDYSEYHQLLVKHVKLKNVDYQGVIVDKDVLVKFTQSLGKKSPDSHPMEFPTKAHQLSYWINAYNAYILKIIVENYPVDSIKDINFIGFTVWLTKNQIGGEEISFKSLEDDIIRERFGDPRIHFAINCASASCPPIAPGAYLHNELENQLNEMTTLFINDTTNFNVDEKNQIIYLSSIFDWYEDDFLTWLINEKGIEEPVLLDYISIYLKRTINEAWRNYDVKFYEYDWRLNDIVR